MCPFHSILYTKAWKALFWNVLDIISLADEFASILGVFMSSSQAFVTYPASLGVSASPDPTGSLVRGAGL